MARGWLLVLAVILAYQSAALAARPACTDAECSEQALQKLHLVPADNPIAAPYAVSGNLTAFLKTRQYAGWRHDIYPRTNDIRLTGPFVNKLGFTTHARVRVFYSMGVVKWLEGGRQGPVPDGAMIVKEMYPLPEVIGKGEPSGVSGWAVLVRDSSVSRDGWLWSLYYLPHNQTFNFEYQRVQYGISFCISCHAASDRDQGTFAFLGNLEGRDVATYVATDPLVIPESTGLQSNPRAGAHGAFASFAKLHGLTMNTPVPSVPSVEQFSDLLMYNPTHPPNQAVDVDLWRVLRTRAGVPAQGPAMTDLSLLPMDLYDHVLAPAGERKELFLTSDVCSGCHDASALLNNVDPNMTLPLSTMTAVPPEWADARATMVNVSPYGEWSGSLMSLSARDPVFRAQLESELAALSLPKPRADVQQLCMSCHAVMGQRRFPALAREPGSDYAIVDRAVPRHDRATIEKATFGALARDGVSCTVCHHIAPTNLGSEKTFTARFDTGPASEMYGPFTDVKAFLMDRALGVKPGHGSQIQDAGLCGSCHVVVVPVLSGDGTPMKYVVEQATFMECANSVYAGKGRDAQTCQECHMPRTNPISPKHEPLQTKIVNVEDTTFPYVPNRAGSDALDVAVRDNYRRHTLTGINVFTMAMFQQFPLLLGSNIFLPNRAPNVLPPKMLAVNEAREQARDRTAELRIENVSSSPGAIDVKVRVTNLAGHKLPSGVGFRRAFLELAVLNASGDVLWCSGCTDDVGVIVDGDGVRLGSEFATAPSELQPDFAQITKQSQVQIYEARHTDCEGKLTTSFVHLCNPVKDNRILPQGWSDSGPFSKVTRPVALAGPITPGVDYVSYHIPQIKNATAIRATLYYQTIPPYYLADRSSLLAGAAAGVDRPETKRLLYMALHLDVAGPQVGAASWKLPVGCRLRPIQGGKETARP